MLSVEAAADLLAARHAEEIEPDPEQSVTNLSDSARHDGWTLRSALVRLAQPDPVRAGAVLELTRRSQRALKPLTRSLERHTVRSERYSSLSETLSAGRGVTPAPSSTHPPSSGAAFHPEARVVDLVRLVRSRPSESDALIAAYRNRVILEADEIEALPLLDAVLALDELAEVLARWAPNAPNDLPVELIDATCRNLSRQLDRLGIGPEPEPTGRGRSRS